MDNFIATRETLLRKYLRDNGLQKSESRADSPKMDSCPPNQFAKMVSHMRAMASIVKTEIHETKTYYEVRRIGGTPIVRLHRDGKLEIWDGSYNSKMKKYIAYLEKMGEVLIGAESIPVMDVTKAEIKAVDQGLAYYPIKNDSGKAIMVVERTTIYSRNPSIKPIGNKGKGARMKSCKLTSGEFDKVPEQVEDFQVLGPSLKTVPSPIPPMEHVPFRLNGGMA